MLSVTRSCVVPSGVALMLIAGSASAQTGEVVLHTLQATAHGNWSHVADSSAAGGSRIANTNYGAAKLTTALASPADYFELQFQANAGVGYRLWIRAKASSNAYANDSVHLQFSDSVTAAGAAANRIGTTASTVYTIEDCSGCGVSGWGWNDNFYGSTPGELIYFASTGFHTLRVQIREDGISIDQIVLSPAQYLTASPGQGKNDSTILAESSATETVAVASTGAETAVAPVQSGEIVLHTSQASAHGNWEHRADSSAAGGSRIANANHGAAKVMTALANPVDYFDLPFEAAAGIGYRLWIRGSAASNSWANDSVHVQFSDSVTRAGTASYRIGTTASTVYTIEDCSGCGVSGWGWNDNSYGSTPGELIYFASTGAHTVRVQVREDGISIDQIALSPVQYLTTSPGKNKNDSTILAESGTVAAASVQEPDPAAALVAGNLPPVFETGTDGFRIGALQGSMAAPATVLLTASATGPESSDTLTYTWTFGDGSDPVSYVQSAEPSRQNAMHTYTAAGTYTATVSIADQAGNVVTRSGTLTVGPPAAATGGTTLKVLQLNTYKGRTTDTRTEQSKVWLQARWMAASGADVILLQEVMGTTHAEAYKRELDQLTGVTWSYFYRSDANTSSSSLQGIAIFTRKAILNTASMAYAACPDAQIRQRAAIAVTVEANGRNITLIDTHLSSYSTTADQKCRSSQARQLSAWAQNLGPVRIITGDLNADPAEDAIQWLVAKGSSLYNDTWAAPRSGMSERRLSYPDNPVGSMVTRTERIDYVLTSQGAPLELLSVQVPDTRDYTNDNAIASQGQTKWAFHNAAPRASDHEMLVATFAIH